MTKNTKIFISAIFCTAVLCFIMGTAVRNSYAGYSTFEQMEAAENLQEYCVQLIDAERRDYFHVSAENYKDLEKMSDLIVKVSAANERELYPRTVTKTKVIVEEVWKGEAETGQPVYIYEPAAFSYSVSKSYKSMGGYQIMEAGKEYYLFLQKMHAAQGYQMSDMEAHTYLPSTAAFSKFPVQEGDVKTLDEQRLESDGYNYGEIQNIEIITSNKKMLSKYKEIKKEVLKRFGTAASFQ